MHVGTHLALGNHKMYFHTTELASSCHKLLFRIFKNSPSQVSRDPSMTYLKTFISPESDIAMGTLLIYKLLPLVSTNIFDDAGLPSLAALLGMYPWTDQESLANLDSIYQGIAFQHHAVGLNRHDCLHHCIV